MCDCDISNIYVLSIRNLTGWEVYSTYIIKPCLHEIRADYFSCLTTEDDEYCLTEGVDYKLDYCDVWLGG